MTILDRARRLYMLVPALLAAALAAPAHARTPAAGPAQLWYSEQFVVHSNIVGRDFLIQVGLPLKPMPGKSPALFLLDGTASFALAQTMLSLDGFAGTFEPAFVIGIGYPVQTKAEWDRLRQIDLTHAPVPSMMGGPAPPPGSSGGGAAFERFLVEELRPMIEARYRTDPHRAILAGHSYGGLFAARVLLDHPTEFDAYLIGSPSVWADAVLLAKAKGFVAPTRTRVFIGVGAEEALGFDDQFHMVGNTGTLAALLTGHESRLDLKFEIFPGEGHVGSIPVLLEHGFHFLLPPAAD